MAPDPTKNQPTRKRLIIVIVTDDIAVFSDPLDLITTDAAFHHLRQSMLGIDIAAIGHALYLITLIALRKSYVSGVQFEVVRVLWLEDAKIAFIQGRNLSDTKTFRHCHNA